VDQRQVDRGVVQQVVAQERGRPGERHRRDVQRVCGDARSSSGPGAQPAHTSGCVAGHRRDQEQPDRPGLAGAGRKQRREQHDRLWWGEEPLAHVRDRIELVNADVRDVPPDAFDGVDAVINLSGLSNDPTAEYDPEANWQMNALATEALGKACVERGIKRFVFASSCSLYDGLPPGMHDETAAIDPKGAYATSKRYGEDALLALVGEGLDAGIVRNG